MRIQKQIQILSDYPASFERQIEDSPACMKGLKPVSVTTMQVNVGKLCNQACTHCHVGASPTRKEIMKREIVDACLKILKENDSIKTLDLTGGAPEMNPHFRYFVSEAHKMGKHVIDRCNLTILEEPGYEYLYEFLSEHEVEIVASLPYYRASKTDQQRGDGVFEKSVTALRKLNDIGYGSRHRLNLVYNPAGLYLSASQYQLEREFKKQLKAKYDISFDNLLCINNFPIGRFLSALVRAGKFERYMKMLIEAYNSATVDNLMCRYQMSVGYDGQIYDCDFNQMLDITAQSVSHVNEFDYNAFVSRRIKVGNHCFGCTAGSGSSCGGELSNN